MNAASRLSVTFRSMSLFDSADVWANQQLFRLGSADRPAAVAGVPPDLFTDDGQLWGNPLFDWVAMRRDGYAWWRMRVAETLELVDIIRIDHFRGFAAGWAVPIDAMTAREGRWEVGPGREVFDAIWVTSARCRFSLRISA